MNETLAAGTGRRGRSLWWVPFALGAVASAVLAVLAPSSWWGVAFVLCVAGVMATARDAAPEAYRAAWGRSTARVLAVTGVAGAAYAFAVEPFGPRDRLAAGLALLLALSAFGAVGLRVRATGTSPTNEALEYSEHVARQGTRY